MKQDHEDTAEESPAGRQRGLALRLLILSWGRPGSPYGSSRVLDGLLAHFDPAVDVTVLSTTTRSRWMKSNTGEIRGSVRIRSVMIDAGNRSRRLQIPISSVRTLLRSGRPDIVMPIYPDGGFLFLGLLVHLLRRCPLVPYFHNAYAQTKDTRTARTIERMVIRRSSVVLFISEGLAEHYRATYPSMNSKVVVHPIGGTARAETITGGPRLRSGGPHFVFGGNVNESNTDALRRLVHAAVAIPKSRVTILSAAPTDALRRLGVLPEGTEHLFLDQHEFEATLRSADVLLLPHGFDSPWPAIEIATIFPTKLVEYLGTGVPIVVHAPANSFVARFVRETGCAALVDDVSVDAVRDCLAEVVAAPARYDQLAAAARKSAHMFDPRSVTAGLENILRAAAQRTR